MKYLELGSLWVPWLCVTLEYNPGPLAQSICCVEDGKLVAGAIYDHYNGNIVHGHIYINGTPCREWFVCIFDYPFNVLKVRKLVGQVPSNHLPALKIDKNLGFIEEGRVKDYYGEGVDLIVLTMTKDQCKFLNDERWRPYADKVRATRHEQNAGVSREGSLAWTH